MVKDAIPVTSVARTLVDLADVVDATRLARATEQAERLGLLDLGELQRAVGRAHGRRGLKLLLPLLADYGPAPATRSELERRFVRLCEEAGLPRPAINAWIEGYEVDALWSDQRVVVELDGFEFHRTRDAFERDRARDAHLQVAGYRVLRITYRRLERSPRAVAAELEAVLGREP